MDGLVQNVKTKSHDSITAFKDKTETIISAFWFHTSYYNQSAVKLSQCEKQRHAAKYASNIVLRRQRCTDIIIIPDILQLIYCNLLCSIDYIYQKIIVTFSGLAIDHVKQRDRKLNIDTAWKTAATDGWQLCTWLTCSL